MEIKDSILYRSRGCCAKRSELGELQATSIHGCQKLQVTNWLNGIPIENATDIYEIRFKNTRKGYYKNVSNLSLKVGDIVAVEASPGHDTGIVSLEGPLVFQQMKRHGIDLSRYEFRRIYRKVKPVDIEKWQEAVSLEHSTMIRTRQIVQKLGLNMKIGDVEYQGDRTKAIFYYIADERVDFRELIKILAEEFHIRIEMRQIGARQEAGLIGGIGSCGRELCCAQWMCSFVSVSTGAARYQDISLNPQKLAGQCSKLKCCLNFELETYVDAIKDIPRVNAPLDTVNGPAYLMKTDVLKRQMWFSFDKDAAVNVTILSVDRVRELLELNKRNKKIESLKSPEEGEAKVAPDFKSAVGEDSITRFDEKKKKKNNRSKNKNKKAKPEQAATNGGDKPIVAGGKERVKEKEKEKKENNGQQQEKADGDKPNNPKRRRNNRKFQGKKKEGGSSESAS